MIILTKTQEQVIKHRLKETGFFSALEKGVILLYYCNMAGIRYQALLAFFVNNPVWKAKAFEIMETKQKEALDGKHHQEF